MIRLTIAAERRLVQLLESYEAQGRIAAIRKLRQTFEYARTLSPKALEAGRRAPRPYPELRALGFRWVKHNSYWIAYTAPPEDLVIVAIMHDRSDIPNQF